MSEINPPLTKQDFIDTCWEDIVNSSQEKACFYYWDGFWKKAQESQEPRETEVFELLATITSPGIDPESTGESFVNISQNCTEDLLNFLTEIAPEISDAELRARVADILWVIQRKYQMAQLAVDAYLESATTLESPEHWTFCFDRIRRSLQLAHKINYKTEVVFEHIETVLNRYQGEDPLLLSAMLMDLLQEYEKGDPIKYAQLAEKAAQLAESASKWHKARILWKIKAKWHRMEKDDLKERVASMLEAETYVKEGESALQLTPPNYFLASINLQYAVQAFRTIRGTKEETIEAKARAEEIHKRLLEYQEQILSQMITHSQTTDIGELVDSAIDSVKGRDFQQALFSLAVSFPTTNVPSLKKQVQEQAKNFVASHLFTAVFVNEKGKVTARQSTSIFSNNPEEVEQATYFEMCKTATSYHQSLTAQGYIEPARKQINLEHSVRINDILSNESTLFDLKCLLVERSGSNLRNLMAHGLIDDVYFYSPLMSYIWWLTLRLCLIPVIKVQPD